MSRHVCHRKCRAVAFDGQAGRRLLAIGWRRQTCPHHNSKRNQAVVGLKTAELPSFHQCIQIHQLTDELLPLASLRDMSMPSGVVASPLEMVNNENEANRKEVPILWTGNAVILIKYQDRESIP
jgi:hypothetical protein